MASPRRSFASSFSQRPLRRLRAWRGPLLSRRGGRRDGRRGQRGLRREASRCGPRPVPLRHGDGSGREHVRVLGVRDGSGTDGLERLSDVRPRGGRDGGDDRGLELPGRRGGAVWRELRRGRPRFQRLADDRHLAGSVPGTLNGVSAVNPNTLSGTLPKAWFADFSDVPQDHLFHGAVEKIFRAGITSGCGSGNYCSDEPVNRASMAVFLLRGEHGGAHQPAGRQGRCLRRRAARNVSRQLDRRARCQKDHDRLRRRQLLSRGSGQSGRDGGLSAPRRARRRLPSSSGGGGRLRRRAPWDVPRRLDRAAGRRRDHQRLRDEALPPGQTVSRGEMAVFLARTFGLN